MKRRHRRFLLNLGSFALLGFAFYLTFLKKETPGLSTDFPPAVSAKNLQAQATVKEQTQTELK